MRLRWWRRSRSRPRPGSSVPVPPPRPGDSVPSRHPGAVAVRGRPGGAVPAPRAEPVTVWTEAVQFTCDRDGFVLRNSRRTVTGSVEWVTYADLRWSAVDRMIFDTTPHDPVVALYACLSGGGRRHLADAGRLRKADWERLAAAIAASTGERVVLDLSTRDNPRSIRDS